ncbi:MAG: hypothetical protein V2I43_24505 [Parvularcula sp.]|jgi:hypothetical protein|nr:hypothetical protein [Parvularcula sp.]
MSWRIDNHPAGGLQIEHLVHPRFTARWTTGAFPFDQVEEGAFFWTDEGSGFDDAVHLFCFVWIDPLPVSKVMCRLIGSATLAIEAHALGWK